jgi:hypothetical protein
MSNDRRTMRLTQKRFAKTGVTRDTRPFAEVGVTSRIADLLMGTGYARDGCKRFAEDEIDRGGP